MMTKAKWYRERAAHSLSLAESATDEQQRALLMQMAEAWTRLAEGQERLAELKS